MAMASNLEQGQSSEWALLRRHSSERVFGVQIASHHPEQTTRVAKVGFEISFKYLLLLNKIIVIIIALFGCYFLSS